MGRTKIEWCEFSINPIRARNVATGKVGHFCEKISPGCAHCYAAAFNLRKMSVGTGVDFIPQNRKQVELFLDEKQFKLLRRRAPSMFFWCNMTDLFFGLHLDAWINKCIVEMARANHHIHQVLTKRPDRMQIFFTDPIRRNLLRGLEHLPSVICDEPLPNVWLGVSVENQDQADKRIPLLLQTPAAVRFLSVEPLLEPISLSWPIGTHAHLPGRLLHGIDWVIVGGESGPRARRCDVQWVRSIMEQCLDAGVPCFVKQLGSYVVDRNDVGFDGESPTAWPMDTTTEDLSTGWQGEPVRVRLRDKKGGNPAEWPEDLRVRQFPKKAPQLEATTQ